VRARTASSLMCALVLGACAEPSAAPPATVVSLHAPEWNLPAEPSFQVGADGGEAYQLDRVRGALRLSNGNIAVLDGGSSELRVFDRDGKHVSTLARKGSGPGELQMPWTMYRRGDTIFVVDVRHQHLTLFGPDGELIGTRPADVHGGTGNVYLHDASVVVGPSDGAAYDGVNQVIARLPRSAEPVRQVRVAAPDRIWLRSDSSRSRWTIVDATPTAIGTLNVPDNFTVYDVGRDYVLGVWEDSLGVQTVREYELPSPGSDARTVRAVPRRQQANAGDHAALRELLDRLQLYQEHYYSRPASEYTYATSMEELSGFAPPASAGVPPLAIPAHTIVRITRGDRSGWFGVAADTAADAACAVGHGFSAPTGWSNGTVACY
jgi:hypothetical protein